MKHDNISLFSVNETHHLQKAFTLRFNFEEEPDNLYAKKKEKICKKKGAKLWAGT